MTILIIIFVTDIVVTSRISLSWRGPTLFWPKGSDSCRYFLTILIILLIMFRMSYIVLFYYNYLRVFKFRNIKTTILSRKKITSSFKDTRPLKIYTSEFLYAKGFTSESRVLA